MKFDAHRFKIRYFFVDVGDLLKDIFSFGCSEVSQDHPRESIIGVFETGEEYFL